MNGMTRYIATFLLALALLFSCSNDDGDGKRRQQPARETIIVFMPWIGANQSAGGLLSFFQNNVSDMKKSMKENNLQDIRLLVCICEDAGSARLLEITADGSEKTVRKYTAPDFYTASGIASMLKDAANSAPASRYSMIVSGHGLGWVSKSVYNSGTSFAPARVLGKYRRDLPLTRFFGHAFDESRQIDIATLAGGIGGAGLKMHFVLFDGCNMANVETAFMLRSSTDYLIACPTEIMGYGMPYREMLPSLAAGDYKAACEKMIAFYKAYSIVSGSTATPYPYATISVTKTSELDQLASLMKSVNASASTAADISGVQTLDGFSPTIFYDLGSYVSALCSDAELLRRFNAQLQLAVPYKGATDCYYTSYGNNHVIPIRAYSGITVSDPSTNSLACDRQSTDWWAATH